MRTPIEMNLKYAFFSCQPQEEDSAVGDEFKQLSEPQENYQIVLQTYNVVLIVNRYY